MLQRLVAGLGTNSFLAAGTQCQRDALTLQENRDVGSAWHAVMDEPPAMTLYVTLLTGNSLTEALQEV